MKIFSTIINLFKSNYCKTVFFISVFLGYIMLPKNAFHGWMGFLAYIFIGSFALTMTCLVGNIKERIKNAKAYQGSIIGLIASSLGIVALQVCGSNGLFCGASILSGFLSSLLPHFLFSFFETYGHLIIVASILMQIYSLFRMRCIKLKLKVKL